MTLAQKKIELVTALSGIRNPQQRLSWLIERARQSPPLPPDLKNDANKIEGCLSNLWLMAEFKDGACHFVADSDSQIMKAVAGLLCELYSGQPPEAILSLDPSFLGPLGITQHLTQNRRNGLTRVWEKIRVFAEAQSQPIVRP